MYPFRTLRSLVCALALLASLPLAAAPSAACKNVPLRVMSWNIWHGVDRQHGYRLGPYACTMTQELMKAAGADVIVIVESYGAAPTLAKALGFYCEEFGRGGNLTILSRYPIVGCPVSTPSGLGRHNFGSVTLDVCGRRVHVVAVWFNYLPDTRLPPTEKGVEAVLKWEDFGSSSRPRQSKAAADAVRPLADNADAEPVILAGDFNSHSHLDWTDATKDLYDHGGIAVPWKSTKNMTDIGLIDSFRTYWPNPVSHPGVTWSATGEDFGRQDRIDFILYKGKDLSLTGSHCFNGGIRGEFCTYKGRPYMYPSDHGFVVSDFILSVPRRPSAK